MTLSIEHSLPEWLIDDTANITNARVFVVHTQKPRFIGELMPGDEAEISGLKIVTLKNQVLCRIFWIDDPVFDANELCRSLDQALQQHFSLR